jgi:hypothetical protein
VESIDLAIKMRDEERLSESIDDFVFRNPMAIIFEDYGHHEDIYDLDTTIATYDPSLFVSNEDLTKFNELVENSIIRDHIHDKFDVRSL